MASIYAKGCLEPKVDVRDYTLARPAGGALPSAYVTPLLPEVKNQGSVCSCVAHATSSILEYHEKMEQGDVKLSTNFIYGIQKKVSGYAGKGMYLRDACKIVHNYGDVLNSDCPGNTEVPEVHAIAEAMLDNSHALEVASYYKILSYVRLQDIEDIKYAIYNYGPVLASVKWFDNFTLDKDNVLRGKQEGSGGHHAVMIYGWNGEGFLVQNSWGKNWGEGGRFVLPYEIPVREAWQLVDATNDDIVKPKRNAVLDFIYLVINTMANFFKQLFTKS